MASVVVVESGVDRTVRALSKAWRDCDAMMAGPQYVGPDHCTMEGASKLAQRLKSYWAARGIERAYEIYPLFMKEHGKTIYAIRTYAPIVQAAVVEVKPEPIVLANPAPRQVIKTIIHETLKDHPSVSYKDVMNRNDRTGRGARPQTETAARQACIRAVVAAFPAKSLPELGVIFNLDHTSVLFLLNDEFRARHNAGTLARLRQAKAEQVAA